MKHVAIIGAGMAGLSALQTLKQHDIHVTVFDKSRGSGGRMATKKVGESSWDMGAQFMRAHTDEFASALHTWQANGWIEPWLVEPFKIDEHGITPSPDDVVRYVGTPRMTGLSRKLLASADEFMPSTRIVSTHFDGQHWQLSDDNDGAFEGFDAIIVNTPPEQAKPLLPSALADDIDATMHACWTLLLAFDIPIATPVDAAFVKVHDIAWLARNNSKPARDAQDSWVVQANHAWSDAHSDDDRSVVQQHLTSAFFKALGVEQQAANAQWLHRWLYAVPNNQNTQPDGQRCLIDHHHKLSVCGDWLSGLSSLEGAYLSGQESGAHIAHLLNSSS